MTEQEALAELKSFPVNCLDFKEQIALDMAIAALEAQISKEPLNQQGDPLFGYCPNCGSAIYQWLSKLACKECLQRLKWRGDE